MTWREKLVVRILLVIAQLVYLDGDPAVAAEIKALATHISVHAPAKDAS